MRRIKSFILLFSFVSVFSFSACDTVEELGLNVFSDSDEVQLGMQVDNEIRSNPKEYPIYAGDPSVKTYINERIFQHILNSPEVRKKGVYQYRVEIIANDSVLNAFATPGGYVYVYSGLLKYLDSEAALAGIVGHEIAHAERRHATQRMTQQYGVSVLLGMILGENPSQITQLVTNLFVGMAFLKNSRSNEDESDEYSVKYLKSTRYYPGSVKFFFEKMRDDGLVNSNSSKLEIFLSTHPDPIARIKSTDDRMQQMGQPVLTYKSNDASLYKAEYLLNIKNKLK